MQKGPREILRSYWGHKAFRGSQEKVITAVLHGKDVLALLPTGGGKSVCYQVPAMIKEGICIVVSPLVALIQNQVDSLKKKGIKAIALTGGISFEELNALLDNCIYGNYKFLYLSPERLQQSLVRERLEQMKVSLVAIDEAHCISQWGHDFRPAYLSCATIRELQPEAPILALTATATAQVSQDIMDNLQFETPLVIKDSYQRPNIVFCVRPTEDKLYQLKKILKSEDACGIVYVRTRKKTVELSNYLNNSGISAKHYHGGLLKSEKKERLDQWLNNTYSVIVATNAFGMGVDKPDVRNVVHYQLPDSLENYFQEAGRAGRDGKPAKATLLIHPEDKEIAKKQFLESLPNVAFLKTFYRTLNTYLQIAYGEGSGKSFGLHFNAFCSRYALPSLKTYNALRLLDQNSILSLSEAFGRKTTLHITTSRETLFHYLENHKEDATIILSILRTYGGILDFETNINTHLMAKKTGKSEKSILALLKKLDEADMATLHAGEEDLQLTFLVPREDDKTINSIQQKVTLLQKQKERHLDQMVAYADNAKQCRSKIILDYFGESPVLDCGICDICDANKADVNDLDLERSLLKELKTGPKNGRDLIVLLQLREETFFALIRKLLEDETILINYKNQYELNA